MNQSPFDVLGLPRRFALDPRVLEERVRDLQKALHPDRHANGAPAERRAAMSRAVSVNEAYRALRDDLSRAAALLEGAPDAPADPALLMEVMELRESLSEAREARSIERVRTLAVDVRARVAASRSVLERALDEVHDTAKAREALTQLRYYRRFLDEVEVAEDDALEA